MSLRLLALLGLALMLSTGCDKADDDDVDDDDATADDDDTTPGDDDDTTAGDDDDTGDDDSAGDDDTGDDDDTAEDRARWLFLVFINGDNDLEGWVTRDLNELEEVGSGDDVHVVVQADRIDGYAVDDGDWTNTRRYYIEADGDLQNVNSTVLDDMAEQDMGDPAVLTDFLLWAYAEYPADHIALSMWNHGDGWSLRNDGAADSPEQLGFISWDDTSGNFISFAEGEFRDALQPLVDLHGPIDVVGFDACNMACWEVGHAMREQVGYMAASESTVGMEGFMYAEAIALLRDVASAPTGADLADNLASSAVDIGNEWTFSATDLSQMDALAQAIDELAGVVLADPSLEQPLLECRTNAGAADFSWHDWYLDLYDFANLVSQEDDATLAAAGQGVLDAMDDAIIGAYGSQPFEWTGGLTIFMDTTPGYLSAYINGDGATWAAETRWDDLLLELAGVN
jgi:hypothetical protein